MNEHEPPLFEGTLPGVFVPDATIRQLDSLMAALFGQLELACKYLTDEDDLSLEYQLLRVALPEAFLNLLQRMDSAHLLDRAAQRPHDMRRHHRGNGEPDEFLGILNGLRRLLPPDAIGGAQL